MQINLPPELVYTRDQMFDEILENAFEASLIVDREGTIVYISSSGIRTVAPGYTQKELFGKHISTIHPDTTHFLDVIASGKIRRNVFHQVAGSTYLHTMIPIKWEGDTYAVLAVMTFRTFSSLKATMSQLPKAHRDRDANELFNLLARRELYTFSDYIGESTVVKKLIKECQKAAGTGYAILIMGETGTGKEILANAIHAASARTSFHPFFRVNCPAIPDTLLESELFGHEKGAFTGAVTLRKGKFELAGAGSILLDEIGEMDIRLQAKLLRVLEEREFERVGGIDMLPMNARVIASTNANLVSLCQEGRFRSDLYYRLSAIEIHVPPLRARTEDIPLLVRHFAARENYQTTFGDAAVQALQSYDWPGNVRQLRNILNRLGILHEGGAVTGDDVRRALEFGATTEPAPSQAPRTMADTEKEALLQALRDTGHNLTATARLLGISRPTLYRKLEKHGIQAARAQYR